MQRQILLNVPMIYAFTLDPGAKESFLNWGNRANMVFSIFIFIGGSGLLHSILALNPL